MTKPIKTLVALASLAASPLAAQEVELDIYGYVKLDLFYDFDFEQGDTTSARALIPGNATDSQFGTNVRQSRLGIFADVGDARAQLEYDLFGSNGTSELRLRHANIRYNGFIFGQFWTNFQPIGQAPTTVDFAGPVGISFARVPQVRYTWNNGDGLQLSASIEENFAPSSDPLVTAAAQYNSGGVTLRGAVLAGTTEVGGTEFDQFGYTLTGVASPWQGGKVSLNYTAGDAIGGLMIGGGDAAVGGVENGVDAYTLELRQDISDRLNVGIAYGEESYDFATVFSGTDFTDLESVHVNAFYDLNDRTTLSIEYSEVTRTDSGGIDTSGGRLQGAIQLNF